MKCKIKIFRLVSLIQHLTFRFFSLNSQKKDIMKKLIPLFLILVLAFSCKDECKDEFCPAGYVCVEGVCETADGSCPIGYEGDDCLTPSNAKFAGSYDVDYTGTGGLSASSGTTVADVALVAGTPNKIRIDVDLDVEGNVLGQAIPLELSVSIEGETDGDNYSIPSTTIETEVEVGGFPLPVELTFSINGTKASETELNSTLTMAGLLTGTIVMTGVK